MKSKNILFTYNIEKKVMPDFSLYRRIDLIKIIRANPSYLPQNIIKHSKEELINICNNIKDLNLTTAEELIKINKIDKQPEIINNVDQRITLNELTDDSESEEDNKEPLQKMNRPSRLNRKKINLPQEQIPIINKNKKNEEETNVRQILKDYTVDVRDLLLNFDDDEDIDIYDEKAIITEYNKIREETENQIDNIIHNLQEDFTNKFYEQISKILDQSLTKVQSFLNLK